MFRLHGRDCFIEVSKTFVRFLAFMSFRCNPRAAGVFRDLLKSPENVINWLAAADALEEVGHKHADDCRKVADLVRSGYVAYFAR